jgi:hypothetical protein
VGAANSVRALLRNDDDPVARVVEGIAVVRI